MALHRSGHHSARRVAEPAPRKSLRIAGPRGAWRLPGSATFANPSFLRPLVGVRVPAHSYLHMLAIDLARSPDGQWWVLADRAQAPSGSGYALENRTIVSDVLPDLFRTSNVLRLAPFFRAQREALTSLAQCDNPRIVLLTPGPTTRPTSNTLISHATWDSLWSEEPILRCAIGAYI